MKQLSKKTFRKKTGFSLLEMVITTVLFGITMLILSQLVVVAGLQSLKSANRAYGQAAARRAIDRIRSDIRQAHNLGDNYGLVGNRLSYPAATNPHFKNGRTPVGGWPPAPWQAIATLSETTLVLQTPVVYSDPQSFPNTPSMLHGMPVRLEAGAYGANDPTVNMENWNTIVYEVVPDLERPNEYQLQVAEFPGAPSSNLNIRTNTTLINPPKTIARGLVGPKTSGSSIPRVFTYLIRGRSATGNIDDSDLDSISGVGIDLEVTNSAGNSEVLQGPHQEIVGVHGEEFLRCNKNMQFNNL